MDDIDRKILKLLQENARTSLKTIAESTFLSSPAVSARIERMEKDGVISGDMIARVDCCVEAARSGVKSSTVLDGTIPHAILLELLSDAGVGTMLKN